MNMKTILAFLLLSTLAFSTNSQAGDTLCTTWGPDGDGLLWLWEEPSNDGLKTEEVKVAKAAEAVSLKLDGQAGMLLLKDPAQSKKSLTVTPRIFGKKINVSPATLLYTRDDPKDPKRKFVLSYGPNLGTFVGFENEKGELLDLDEIRKCHKVSSTLRSMPNQSLLRASVQTSGPNWLCATPEFQAISKKLEGNFQKNTKYKLFENQSIMGSEALRCVSWVKADAARSTYLSYPEKKTPKAH